MITKKENNTDFYQLKCYIVLLYIYEIFTTVLIDKYVSSGKSYQFSNSFHYMLVYNWTISNFCKSNNSMDNMTNNFYIHYIMVNMLHYHLKFITKILS